ncbi:MAG: hypothetical protein ACRYFX_14860 [Janthinobacterium lividum]
MNFLQSRCLLLVAYAGLLAGAASSCQVLRPTSHAADTANYCDLPRLYEVDTLRASVADPVPTDTIELPRLSARSRQLARAFGLGQGLRRLDHLERADQRAPNVPARDAYLSQRQHLITQVLLASAETLRVAEELDCEEQRANQAAADLQRRENHQIRNLTIGSIAAGVGGGLAGELLETSTTEHALAVGGAIVSAGLGIATLFVNPRQQFLHPRNLLADTWYYRSRSSLYPAGLWAVLSAPPAGAAQLAPLQTTRQRWLQYDQLSGHDAPAQQMLYFGTGGRYDADELRTRSNMLGQLEGAVRLVNQDLQQLLVELSNAEPR